MTPIYFMSDLHLGVNRRFPWKFTPPPKPGILLLPGDIFDEGVVDEPLISKWCAEFEHVVFTPGNHEYYYNSIVNGFDSNLKNADYLPDNFHFLNCDTIEFDDVIVIGATLWTDLDNCNPIRVMDIVRGMTDFRLIAQDNNSDYTITSEFIYNIHKRHLDYISHAYDINKDKDKPIVVMTHHAPSLQSIHSAFRGSSINGGFVSDLDQFILDRPKIDHWIHGHTHAAMQYTVGNTVVSCNPGGYRGETYNKHDDLKFEMNKLLTEV